MAVTLPRDLHLPFSPADVRELTEGWSLEEKLILTGRNGSRYLLRLCPSEKLPSQKGQYELINRHHAMGLPVPEALGYGLCRDGGASYLLLTYLPGEPLEALLPSLPESRQYALGLEAGDIQRRMHTLPAGPDAPDWDARIRRKYVRNTSQLAACGIPFPHEESFRAAVERALPLLPSRPQCFQHGDYHPGNFLLTPEGRLAVIDYNRWDQGDPWEEYCRFPLERAVSPVFARGHLDAYFPDGAPPDFWMLFILYNANNALGSVPWAVPFGEKEIQTMLRLAEDLHASLDGFAVPDTRDPAQLQTYYYERLFAAKA